MASIDSQRVAYGLINDDECYTLPHGVKPILKYIPQGAVVWCPFDTADSQFVKLISQRNRVIYSHIATGHDFLTCTPPVFDVIISNPPFKNKRAFFERALALGKPFALIMSTLWLNDAAPVQIFGNDLQLLMFDRRMVFERNGVVTHKPTFKCSYFCYKFLPAQLITETLEVPKCI